MLSQLHEDDKTKEHHVGYVLFLYPTPGSIVKINNRLKHVYGKREKQNIPLFSVTCPPMLK